MRCTRRDGARPADTLPAQGSSIWMRGLVGRFGEVVAEHVVDEAQDSPEWPQSSLEHMFARLGTA